MSRMSKPEIQLVTPDGKKSLIHETFLAEMAGVSSRHLRRLAVDGYFPSPVKGYYELSKAIRGVLQYTVWGDPDPENNALPGQLRYQ